MPRREVYRRLSLLAISLAVAGTLFFHGRRSGTESAPAFSCAEPDVTVAVAGDVRHAGLYCISANALTETAIMLAVPARAITAWHASARPREKPVNGSVVSIAVTPAGMAFLGVTSLPVPQRIQLGIPLDINRVAVTELQLLPGVGPVLAGRIIDYRQKNGGRMRKEQLLDVDGIGDGTYQKLKRYF